MPSWIVRAARSSAISAMTLRPKSIPDVTPPAVIKLPSFTIRASSNVAPNGGKRSVKAQWMVARSALERSGSAENERAGDILNLQRACKVEVRQIGENDKADIEV